MKRWTLVYWAISWISGLLAGVFLHAPAVLVITAGIHTFFYLTLRWYKNKNLLLPQLPLLLTFFCFAWFYYGAAQKRYNHIKENLYALRADYFSGMAVSFEPGAFGGRDKMVVSILKPHIAGRPKLLVYLPKRHRIIRPGNSYLFCVSLKRLDPPLNPGQFDYTAYLKQKGIHGVGYANQVKEIEPPGGFRPFSIWLKWGGIAREKLTGFGYKVMRNNQAVLLHAMIYGMRTAVREETIDTFQNTGLMHLLVVSGLHVGFLVMFFTILCGLMKCGVFIKNILTCFLLIVYLSIVGPNPPVLRASFMSFFAIWGWRNSSGKPGAYYLLLSIFFLTFINPSLIVDPSFILSVSALGGILFFAPHFKNLLLPLPKWLQDTCAVSLGAQLGVFPALVYFFGQFPWIGILLNLIAVPLSMLITITGLAGECLGLACFFLGKPLLLAAGMMISLLNAITCHAGKWLWGRIVFPAMHSEWFSSFFLLQVLLYAWFVRNRLTKRRILSTGAFLTAVFILLGAAAWMDWWKVSRHYLELSFLAVGQGNAALFTTPAGRTYALDVGKSGHEMRGYLAYLGRMKLDGVIITHNHQDHAGGLDTILSHHPAAWIGAGDSELTWKAWRNFRVKTLVMRKTKWEIEPDLYLRFYPQSIQGSPNRRSMVLTLQYKKISALLTGDMEETTFQKKMSFFNKHTFLQIPHHGGWNPGLDDLLAGVSPKCAIISVGPNSYGHPSEKTLGVLKSRGIPYLRTDESGCITIRTDGEKYWIKTYRKGIR